MCFRSTFRKSNKKCVFGRHFEIDHMRKDLGIAIEEAKKNSLSLEVTELVDKFYQDIQDMGGNRWDTSSLLRRLKKND